MFRNRDLLYFFKQIESYIELIYYTDHKTFSNEEFALYFSFICPLNKINQDHSNKLLEISHFVTLFSNELAQVKFTDDQKSIAKKQRIKFERMKLDEAERKRLEQEDLDEEIRKEKERDKRKFYKGKKLLELSKKKEKEA